MAPIERGQLVCASSLAYPSDEPRSEGVTNEPGRPPGRRRL
jgi:hypothetical protein